MSKQRPVVLITGSSSGIGKATAEKFAAEGWMVAATMRDVARAPEFRSNGSGGTITTFPLDVTDPKMISAAVASVESDLGPVAAVVNNAGYGLIGPFEAIEPAEIERQFATNVTGLMNVTRAILPGMRKRRRGSIINVTSMGGRLTFPFYSVYHATKWAVEGLSESLQYELRPFGIRVKIIEPGTIRTEFYGRSESRADAEQLGDYRSHFESVYRKYQQIGRTAPGPEIVADAILQAALDRSSRLRYTPNSTKLLALRQIFGERMMRRVIRDRFRP